MDCQTCVRLLAKPDISALPLIGHYHFALTFKNQLLTDFLIYVLLELMTIDYIYKNKIKKQLTLKIAEGLKKQQINPSQASIISSYILNDFDALSNQFQLINFLAKLADKWPIFENIYNIETGKIKEKQEKEAVKKTVQMIKENKINDALQITKESINKKGI